jgi:hypothetical protein
LPATCAASSSTRNRGIGTDRRSCPFGVAPYLSAADDRHRLGDLGTAAQQVEPGDA